MPAFLIVLVLLCSSMVVRHRVVADDVVMVACGTTYVSMQVLIQIEGSVAFGVDVWHVNTDDLVLGMRLLYFINILSLVTLTLAKVSLLAFYRRVISAPEIWRAAHSLFAFVIFSNFILLGTQVFRCNPVEANWEGWRLGYSQPFKCINANPLAIAGAGLNMLQDMMLIVLPVPAVIQANLWRWSEPSIALVFTFGFLAVIASAIKLAFIIPAVSSPNVSWDYTGPLIWTGIDAAFIIIIPCVLTTRGLLTYRVATRASPQPSQQESIPDSIAGSIPLQNIPRNHPHSSHSRG